LVDVMLVLLVVFIVTAPLMTNAIHGFGGLPIGESALLRPFSILSKYFE
jgi:hypothetical protein